MNRTFHARITVYQYLLLGLMGILTLCLLWYKFVLPAVFFMLCLIVYIEKLIHTTYTLTPDGKLQLHFGRFLRGKEISVRDITSVDSVTHGLGNKFIWYRFLRVYYAGKSADVFPVNEAEFIRLLKERMFSKSLSDLSEE